MLCKLAVLSFCFRVLVSIRGYVTSTVRTYCRRCSRHQSIGSQLQSTRDVRKNKYRLLFRLRMFRRARWMLAPTVDDIHNAFKVMGLPSAAPADVVRSKYLELARRHHPDLSSGDDSTMKVINTAYELIQSHRSLVEQAGSSSSGAGGGPSPTDGSGQRFTKRAPPRRSAAMDDLSSGESWSVKSSRDWHAAVDNISEKDLKNPANHPYSFSKYYSFEDDATIYRMLRTGATVAQVARTLSKPATFVEKRLNNAQFKRRVQVLLANEKQSKAERDRVDPRQQTTVRLKRKTWGEMSHEEKGRHVGVFGGGSSHTSSPEWTPSQIASKLGRNYANFERFHKH